MIQALFGHPKMAPLNKITMLLKGLNLFIEGMLQALLGYPEIFAHLREKLKQVIKHLLRAIIRHPQIAKRCYWFAWYCQWKACFGHYKTTTMRRCLITWTYQWSAHTKRSPNNANAKVCLCVYNSFKTLMAQTREDTSMVSKNGNPCGVRVFFPTRRARVSAKVTWMTH